MNLLSQFAGFVIPGFVGLTAILAYARGVDVFGSFVEGVGDGLKLMVRILPYLIAIFVAVGVFQSSGAMDFLSRLLAPAFHLIGVPVALLPVFLIRPLSGSASFGLVAHILKTFGPDSHTGLLASAIQGSSETTLYVLSVYFGAVGVKKGLWALPVCLAADMAGFAAAIFFSHILLGA